MPTKKITTKKKAAPTKKAAKKARPTSRPIVLERWDFLGSPTRLIVREDGELDVEFRHTSDGWLPDYFAEISVLGMDA